jgi:hypothetical protein
MSDTADIPFCKVNGAVSNAVQAAFSLQVVTCSLGLGWGVHATLCVRLRPDTFEPECFVAFQEGFNAYKHWFWRLRLPTNARGRGNRICLCSEDQRCSPRSCIDNRVWYIGLSKLLHTSSDGS